MKGNASWNKQTRGLMDEMNQYYNDLRSVIAKLYAPEAEAVAKETSELLLWQIDSAKDRST